MSNDSPGAPLPTPPIAQEQPSVSLPLVSEQALIDLLPECELPVDSVLILSQGRAQIASLLRQRYPAARLTAWYIDLHQATLAQSAVAEDVIVQCTADLPEGPYGLVVFPVSMRGEAELTRDLLQQAHGLLADGGTLAASVDNPKDQWLREQMEGMFDKVRCISSPAARVYVSRKTKPLRKLRSFQAEIVFRDDDQLIKLTTRPGVFAHRQLDPGARQLLLSVDIEAGQRVMDLGCGSGALALAALKRAPNVTAFAIDSNARALQCATLSAQANEIRGMHTILNADGELGLDDSIDVVLCNPPYYSDFEIAERMIGTAVRALRSGGAILLVNKTPRWYGERMPQSFHDVSIFASGKYWVACGRKP